jgi:hypothetical protein
MGSGCGGRSLVSRSAWAWLTIGCVPLPPTGSFIFIDVLV